MSSVNKVILVGNLGQDPEIKSFRDGGRIANLRIATAERWKDRQTGEKKERTEWHTVSIKSDGLVGVAERFLRKGSKVYVEGQLRTRKWQDTQGNDRYTTEVVLQGPHAVLTMLDGAGSGANREPQQGSFGGSGSSSPSGQDGFSGNSYGDLDDEVPC